MPQGLAYGLLIMSLVVGCSRNTSQPQASSTQASTHPRSFGDRQIEQMLDDRPDMQNTLTPSHPIYRFISEAFNGDRTGSRIYWNANQPSSGSDAEHSPSFLGYPPQIKISDGPETTPMDKWAGVIFEIFNLENTLESERLAQLAIQRELDRDRYAQQCVRLEFVALERTRSFFRENPLPVSSPEEAPWYQWVLHDLGTFEEYRDYYEGKDLGGFNSFEHFKEHYDEQIAPYMEAFNQLPQ